MPQMSAPKKSGKHANGCFAGAKERIFIGLCKFFYKKSVFLCTYHPLVCNKLHVFPKSVVCFKINIYICKHKLFI